MGALAQYFFWHWHCNGEAPPQFQNREDWYRMRVLRGGDLKKDLHYSTHAKFCARAMVDAGVTLKSVTHAMRSGGTQDAEEMGVPEPQVSQFLFFRFIYLSIYVSRSLTFLMYRLAALVDGSGAKWQSCT